MGVVPVDGEAEVEGCGAAEDEVAFGAGHVDEEVEVLFEGGDLVELD